MIVVKNEHGHLHCIDGPAIEFSNGIKQWWINGNIHRLDGPAFITPAYDVWYINGFDVDTDIHEWADERDIDLNNLSDLDKAVIALEWGNYNGN
jgi:hypothetical protein